MQKFILLLSLFFAYLPKGWLQGHYKINLPDIETENLRFLPAFYSVLPPGLSSPALSDVGRELVLLKLNNGRYGWMDATVENGAPFDYKRRLYGKGNQLTADEADFPALAATGIHSEEELRNTKLITGRSVSQITVDGRPWGSSGVGFLAEDETIMSVIWGDNQAVERLGLTHADLARPLFHLWNIARDSEQYGTSPTTGERLQLEALMYNGNEVKARITGSRGWQESIFNDEILGTGHIEVWREADSEELAFLQKNYSHLPPEQFEELKQMLFHLHTGEMVFFYITRYGFYEGHTEYRADPVAVALIFGLKPIEEAHQACEGRLYLYFTTHFTENPE